jgi:hypothetical protein
MVVIGCLSGLFVGLSIGFLGVMHGYHILVNLTTVEMHTTDPSVRILLTIVAQSLSTAQNVRQLEARLRP